MPALLDMPQTIQPSPADQEEARFLAQVLESVPHAPEAQKIRAAFLHVLKEVGKGHAYSLMALEDELTPNQAAELIGVSRPFLMHLLRQKAIPCRQVGSHYRIRLSDILQYQQAQERRHRQVDELVSDREDLGL